MPVGRPAPRAESLMVRRILNGTSGRCGTNTRVDFCPRGKWRVSVRGYVIACSTGERIEIRVPHRATPAVISRLNAIFSHFYPIPPGHFRRLHYGRVGYRPAHMYTIAVRAERWLLPGRDVRSVMS